MDILIKNGRIIDGTGNPAYIGNIMIEKGKISHIVSNSQIGTSLGDVKVIDCKGTMVVAPGFIDTHGHENYYIFHDRDITPKLMQGVTTIIHGNCGFSPAPIQMDTYAELMDYQSFGLSGISLPDGWSDMDSFKKYLDKVEHIKPTQHFGTFVGHGTIRIAAMGFAGRKPDNIEMERMKTYLKEAMESGAMGLSTGLLYAPGSFADTEELIELCKIVAEYDGVYATHMRDESKGIVESIIESIEIARRSGVRLLISHLKVATFEYEELLTRVFHLIDEGVKEGIRIGIDQYPYNAGATVLSALLPGKYLSGGNEKLLELLQDQRMREQIKTEILDETIPWDNIILESGFNNIIISSMPESIGVEGKTLELIGNERKQDPFETLFDLIVENKGQGLCIMFYTEQDCVDKIFQYPLTMVGSDGDIHVGENLCHPRTYGTFPRVLGRFCREKNLVSLEETIHKMTGIPAGFLGLQGKGRIDEGYDADLTIFDAEKIMDRADYADPRKPNEGIFHVIINGELVLENGKRTSAHGMGQLLKKWAGGKAGRL